MYIIIIIIIIINISCGGGCSGDGRCCSCDGECCFLPIVYLVHVEFCLFICFSSVRNFGFLYSFVLLGISDCLSD